MIANGYQIDKDDRNRLLVHAIVNGSAFEVDVEDADTREFMKTLSPGIYDLQFNLIQGLEDEVLVDGFDPNQPRDPKGTSTGGQWTKKNAEGVRENLGADIPADYIEFYHGTSTAATKGIRKQGLNFNKAGSGADEFARQAGWNQVYKASINDRPASVYVTKSKEVAERYANYAVNVAPEGVVAKSVILTIRVPKHVANLYKPDELSRPEDHAFRTSSVPPKWIKSYQIYDAAAEEGVAFTFYAVIVCDESQTVDAFNPRQPRDPKGSPTGGQWTSLGYVPDPDNRVNRSDKGAWGYSHGNSASIAAQAAKMMGIEGYDEDTLNAKAHSRIAQSFLETVYGSPGSKEPLFHGFENRAGIKWNEGDTFEIALASTSGDLHDAAGYGIRGFNRKDEQGEPTVFEFPVGTKISGYSKWKNEDAKDFGHQWSEAIVSGRFKIVSTRTETGHAHWKPTIRVVRVAPVAYFNPTNKEWENT